MGKVVFTLSLIFFLLFFTKPALSFEITSDPQYIVISFTDFYSYNWQAQEKEWQEKVKPKMIKKLREMKSLLTVGTENRRLAWSTLLEYMDFPMDKVTENSPYVYQAKRIMEVAEEENLPVFMPLNGVQWWTQLPELWNYWDYDGNQTPGCRNDDYSQCQFAKLKDPKYRGIFIKGYNPKNKWNVEWQDWERPMGLQTRNWGGGDQLAAPPPNLADHSQTSITFKRLQTERFEAIIKIISKKLEDWQKKGKQDLFAGITIGTEVTLNSALTQGEDQFIPYGYRAIQDTFCLQSEPTCGKEKHWTKEELEKMREKVLFNYFNDLSKRAVFSGLPKERIYSHVWSEADIGERKYTNAIGASINLYSRPGMSLYGKATNPMGFSLLKDTLVNNGYPGWAAPEFAPLTRDDNNWNLALNNTLNNEIDPARVIDIYNWSDIIGTPAIPQLKNYLTSEPEPLSCVVPETIPLTQNRSQNPSKLSWRNLNQKDNLDEESIIFFKNYPPKTLESKNKEVRLDKGQSELLVTLKDWDEGLYYWLIKKTGCGKEKWTTSTPRYFIIQKQKPPLPFWLKFLIKVRAIEEKLGLAHNK